MVDCALQVSPPQQCIIRGDVERDDDNEDEYDRGGAADQE